MNDNTDDWFDDFAPLPAGPSDTQSGDDQSVVSAAPDAADVVGSSDPSGDEPTGEIPVVATDRATATTGTPTGPATDAATSQWAWIAAPEQPPGAGGYADDFAPYDAEASEPHRFPMDYATPAVQPVGPGTRPAPRRRSKRGYFIAAALLACVLVVAGIGALLAFGGGGTGNSPTTDIPQATPQSTVSVGAPAAPVAPAQDADCPNRSEDGVSTGRDPGGTTSGPAVIKAFEHAYYVERNGAKARSYGTELARMGTAASMQAFIDTQLPPGTTYCTRITDRGAGLFSLELSEIPPGGGEPLLIRQLVQTAEVEGRTLITAITKDTNQ